MGFQERLSVSEEEQFINLFGLERYRVVLLTQSGMRTELYEELEKLYNELLKHNVGIFMEWKKTEYGSVEFGILDPDDNMLILSF